MGWLSSLSLESGLARRGFPARRNESTERARGPTPAGRFLPWTVANAHALEAGEKETALEFEGLPYVQRTFKYHAWSLTQLKEKLERVSDDPVLRDVLADTGCAPYLV
jgi:hypothetical protein